MTKELYTSPDVEKVYTIDDAVAMKNSTDEKDIWKVQYLIANATEGDICKVFDNWIDDDIKNRMNVNDLDAIKSDIQKYEWDIDLENLPELTSNTIYFALIDMFLNISENKLKKELIDSDDLEKLHGIRNDIKIIKNGADDKETFWWSLIRKLRNCLAHNDYIMINNGIYVCGAGKKDEQFEAKVSYEFFLKVVWFSNRYERKPYATPFDTKNVDREKWFDANKNNIRVTSILWETEQQNKKLQLHEIKNVSKTNGIQYKVDSEQLSCKQQEFLWEYFKIHEFNEDNLHFIKHFLVKNGIVNDTEIYAIFWKYSLDEEILDLRDNIINFLRPEDIFLKKIFKTLTKWKNFDKWQIWMSDEKIYDKIKRKIPNSEEDSAKNILERILDYKKYFLYRKSIKNFPHSMVNYRINYLKVLYLSKFYKNNPKLLKIIKEKNKKEDNEDKERHIRNAFAHHNYTILPWFNKILLWDRHPRTGKVFEMIEDLDELYQEAVSRVDDDYLDKKGGGITQIN